MPRKKFEATKVQLEEALETYCNQFHKNSIIFSIYYNSG